MLSGPHTGFSLALFGPEAMLICSPYLWRDSTETSADPVTGDFFHFAYAPFVRITPINRQSIILPPPPRSSYLHQDSASALHVADLSARKTSLLVSNSANKTFPCRNKGHVQFQFKQKFKPKAKLTCQSFPGLTAGETKRCIQQMLLAHLKEFVRRVNSSHPRP